MAPKLLDLFCCQGGAGMGYHRAGFDVTGVDLHPQKRYPFTFIQGDALEYLREHGHEYDAIHASPPCQHFSAITKTAKTQDNHPNLIPPVRELLVQLGKPYIIENVPGSPLLDPVVLCGAMFPGLRVYRHRLFESNLSLSVPMHPKHIERVGNTGRQPGANGWMSIAGHFPNLPAASVAMGIDWMNTKGMAQAIPPTYTEYLGKQLVEYLEGSR